jgi:hypothetical protein
MRKFYVVPTIGRMHTSVIVSVTMSVLAVGLEVRVPSQTLGAASTPPPPPTFIPTPIGPPPPPPSPTATNTTVPTATLVATATPTTAPPTATPPPAVPTNTPKPKKTKTPVPTATLPPTVPPVIAPPPGPPPSSPLVGGGGPGAARNLLFAMRNTIRRWGSFHLDVNIRLLHHDGSIGLTHAAADISVRTRQVRLVQVTDLIKRGQPSKQVRLIFEQVGRAGTKWTGQKWMCYSTVPIPDPPDTANLHDPHLVASFAGRPQKIGGIWTYPINVRSHGAAVHAQGLLVSRLWVSDHDHRLVAESSAFTTLQQGYESPTLYTEVFSRYGERVNVRLPQCSRSLRQKSVVRGFPSMALMLESGVLDAVRPSVRTMRHPVMDTVAWKKETAEH